MANNSLQIKCWTVAVTTAFVALSYNWVIFFASAVIILFWILDAYYLSLERRFRDLYDITRVKNDDEIDFSMKIVDYRPMVMKTAFSWSVFPFYSLLIATVVFIGILRIVI